MNLTPIIHQLSTEDFGKMLAACRSRQQRFYLVAARHDPTFEYHVDLPPEPDPNSANTATRDSGLTPLSDMHSWLADEKRFPND